MTSSTVMTPPRPVPVSRQVDAESLGERAGCGAARRGSRRTAVPSPPCDGALDELFVAGRRHAADDGAGVICRGACGRRRCLRQRAGAFATSNSTAARRWRSMSPGGRARS